MKRYDQHPFNGTQFIVVLLLVPFATLSAFGQKVKETELAAYDWICLNSNLREPDIYLEDTLILLRELEIEMDEDVAYDTDIPNTNDCFRFVFSDSTHLLSVHAIDYRNAAVKRVVTVDSLLYDQLDRDRALRSKAFDSIAQHLQHIQLWEHVTFENASDPTARFHLQLRKSGFFRLTDKAIYVVSADRLDGASWAFDSKQQELVITDRGDHIISPQHYTIQRISRDRLRLIRTTIVLR